MSLEPTIQKERLGQLRIVLAIAGGLAALLSGGCSLFFLFEDMSVWPFSLAFGGAPFALGLLVVWMALKLGRTPPKEPPE